MAMFRCGGGSGAKPMTLNFSLNNKKYVNGNARIELVQEIDVTQYKKMTVNSAYTWNSNTTQYVKIDGTSALSLVGQTIDISAKNSVTISMLQTDGYAASVTLNITLS